MIKSLHEIGCHPSHPPPISAPVYVWIRSAVSIQYRLVTHELTDAELAWRRARARG